MRTDLRLFTKQFVNHIADSLEEAISNSEWRAVAIEEAKEGWARLNRKLARDDVPQELQEICARFVLLFEFVGFPAPDDERIEERLRELIKAIDEIYPTAASAD
jgi:hypothetical protein